MKKTLIALAALAATASFAQVTVYGRLDAGYANTKNTTTTTAKGTVDTLANGVQSHNSVSSMWGIKGTEDLGGGMNAFFILEQDVYPANGNIGVSGSSGGVGVAGTVTATASSSSTQVGFNRTSKIGLNGGFGSISFGRDYNKVFSLVGATDVNYLSRISTVTLAAAIGGSTMANLVTYSTPNMGGFTVNVDYGNQDSTVSGSNTATDNVDAKTKVIDATAIYANGPLMVGLGIGNTVTNAGQTGTAAALDAKTEATVLGASYDFGKFMLKGNAITSKTTAATVGAQQNESKEYNLGASVPMGKVTLVAQIARKTQSGTSGAAATLNNTIDLSGTSWVIGADYSLSARTALFAKYGVYGVQNGTYVGTTSGTNDTAYDTKNTSAAVGIKTTF